MNGGRFFKWDWRWVPVLTFAYLLVIFLYAPLPIYSGQLTGDPDDYVRAVQIRNFIETGDWYNVHEPRLDPPQGTEVFSRLVDLPVAAIAAPLSTLAGLNDAILIAAFILPLFILLPLLFIVGRWAYKPLLGPNWSWLAPPLFALSANFISEFTPGRIDHHAWQILLTLAMLGMVLHLLRAEKPSGLYGLASALIVATSFAIGIEALPQMTLMLGFIALGFCINPQPLRKPLLMLGISLPLLTFGYMALLRAPDRWQDITLILPSLVWVKLTVAAGFVFIASALLVTDIRLFVARTSVVVLLTVVVGAVLFWDMPILLQKFTYIDFDDWFVRYFRREIIEQQPVIDDVRVWPGICLASLASYIGYEIAARREDNRRARFIWLVMMALLIVMTLLTLLYALRLSRIWLIMAVPGMIMALRFAFEWLARWQPANTRFAAQIRFFLLCAPLVLGWGYLLFADRIVNYFVPPAGASSRATSCNTDIVSAWLNLAYPQPQTILVTKLIGPQLLFTTQHRVVGGGMYNNSDGIRLKLDAFSSVDMDQVGKLMRDGKIDLIYICDNNDENAWQETDFKDGRIFLRRLARYDLPVWLRKVDVPLEERGALFEVRRDLLPPADR